MGQNGYEWNWTKELIDYPMHHTQDTKRLTKEMNDMHNMIKWTWMGQRPVDKP